mgnify:CR=1 FL=1
MAAKESGRAMNKKIIMIAVQVLVLAGAVGGTWFFMSDPAPEPVAGDEASAEAAAASQKKEPEYYSLSPSFVVNLQGERNIRFLMIEIELMSRRDDVFSRIEQYEPRIRNDLLMLFSNLDREAVATVEQRQNLQEQALVTINGVLNSESGKGGVEAVYFTKFVIQ